MSQILWGGSQACVILGDITQEVPRVVPWASEGPAGGVGGPEGQGCSLQPGRKVGPHRPVSGTRSRGPDSGHLECQSPGWHVLWEHWGRPSSLPTWDRLPPLLSEGARPRSRDKPLGSPGCCLSLPCLCPCKWRLREQMLFTLTDPASLPEAVLRLRGPPAVRLTPALEGCLLSQLPHSGGASLL